MAGMAAIAVVEIEVLGDVRPGVADAVVGSQVDTLILDRTPQPLDEDVVAPGTLAIHRQLGARVLDQIDEIVGGDHCQCRFPHETTKCREIPLSLYDFALTTFFSFRAADLTAIRSLRKALRRVALALQIGFLRMTGQTLSVFEAIDCANGP